MQTAMVLFFIKAERILNPSGQLCHDVGSIRKESPGLQSTVELRFATGRKRTPGQCPGSENIFHRVQGDHSVADNHYFPALVGSQHKCGSEHVLGGIATERDFLQDAGVAGIRCVKQLGALCLAGQFYELALDPRLCRV